METGKYVSTPRSGAQSYFYGKVKRDMRAFVAIKDEQITTYSDSLDIHQQDLHNKPQRLSLDNLISRIKPPDPRRPLLASVSG